MIKTWRAKGNFQILGRRHRKNLISQTFENKDNPEETIEWTLFMGENKSSFIFALTKDLEVIAIKQFRFGSGRVETEVAGGNLMEGEGAEEAAQREFEEETGFRPAKIVPFANNNPFWIEPSCFFEGYNFPFLALDCVRVGRQKLDQNESIDVEVIPLSAWLRYINEGIITDGKTIAMTLLALLYLGKVRV